MTKKTDTRGLDLGGIGIDILALILVNKGQPEVRKLLSKIGSKSGKDIAAPFVKMLQEETAYWLKKNKVK